MATTERWDDAGAVEGADRKPRTTFSALDVLQHDQKRLLFDGDDRHPTTLPAFVDGFDSRRQLISWYQAALVRTFGYVADVWAPSHLAQDQALVQTLVDGRADADSEKNRLLERLLLPACAKAYSHLKPNAAERVNDESTDAHGETYRSIDPERQQSIAMRPGFSRLDRSQAAVLDRLWDGFRDKRGIQQWLHDLPAASAGQIDASIAADTTADPLSIDQLLATDAEARRYRERFAVTVLLPAFADAARELQPAEQPEKQPDDNPFNEVRDC